MKANRNTAQNLQIVIYKSSSQKQLKVKKHVFHVFLFHAWLSSCFPSTSIDVLYFVMYFDSYVLGI